MTDALSQEIEVAKKAAQRAAVAILEIYKQDFKATDKANEQGPVTEADLASNQIIVDYLQEHFPEDAILSEESPDSKERLRHSRVWCIDPLDGTKEFIRKNGEFAIHIGLSIAGKASLGIVHVPAKNQLFWGGPQLGCFLEENGQTTTPRCQAWQSSQTLTLVGSRSHRDPDYQKLSERFGVHKEITHGSAGCKASLVVQNQAHFFFYNTDKISEWDICAPEALLKGAGGAVCDFQGQALSYNKPQPNHPQGVIACHSAELLQLLQAKL